MPLKQPPASILVHSIGVVVVEVANALLKAWMLQALVDGVTEELNVGIQGKLVHGVDTAHVVHHKKEERGPLGTSSVALEHTCKMVFKIIKNNDFLSSHLLLWPSQFWLQSAPTLPAAL